MSDEGPSKPFRIDRKHESINPFALLGISAPWTDFIDTTRDEKATEAFFAEKEPIFKQAYKKLVRRELCSIAYACR